MLYPLLCAMLFTVGAFYTLWVFFLAVMSLKKAYDAKTLPKHVLVLALPIIIIGFAIDIAINYTFMTIIMFEFPKERTVSERLHRHYTLSDGYRKSIATLFVPLLNTFDPNHI